MSKEEFRASAELLRDIPLFRSLGNEELDDLSKSGKENSFASGEQIVKEGDSALGFYLILEGNALVKHGGKTLSKLGRGNFFGEMSLFDELPRSADVVADGATRCLVLLRWNFWAIVAKNPKIARGLLKEMAMRLRATNSALTD